MRFRNMPDWRGSRRIGAERTYRINWIVYLFRGVPMRSKHHPAMKELRAAIRARAAALQGSDEAGEKWLKTPAIGLNGEVPSHLLRSRQGADRVEELLMRLEYGVYS
jgi:uncharacterized protein (DUF2384 family)